MLRSVIYTTRKDMLKANKGGSAATKIAATGLYAILLTSLRSAAGYRFHPCRVYVNILAICILFLAMFSSSTYAQLEPEQSKTKADIKPGVQMNVADNSADTLTDSLYYKAVNIVKLSYTLDSRTNTDYYPIWTYRVVYKIMNAKDTTEYLNDTLKIMSTPFPADCKYNDVKEYATGWTSVRIRVLNVCATSGTNTSCISTPHTYPFLPADIELRTSVYSTRIGKMANINAKIEKIVSATAGELEIHQENYEFACFNDQRFITWTNLFPDFATEYELEWVYIPDGLYVPSESDYFNNYAASETEYAKAFELAEPVRVTTKNTYYPFPEEYPDNGVLYYRVRPVGKLIYTPLDDYDQVAFYPWFFTIALSEEDITFPNDKNWQRVTTFAEDGKFKKVISYYDGVYRSRQSLTHISTDQTVIIAETLYDHEGRGVVQMLPYPEECTDLSYKEDRRQDMAGSDWNKYDFELESATNGHQVKNTVGSSEYYSPSNPFLNTSNIYEPNLYIPDAKKYPYTQVEYMMDGTGRVAGTSGVGPDHQLGSGHETKYFYSNPTYQELVRLFGSNVGNISHYKKNYVIDANGQVSTSYLDQEGRVVATALVGDCPENLIELESAVAETLTVDLMEANQMINGQSHLLQNQFNPIPNTEYVLDYRIPYQFFSMPEGGPCLACVYDLDITIIGPGLNVSFHETINPTVPDPCESDPELYFHWNNGGNPVVLPEIGNYTIYKNLTWNSDLALANITAAVISSSADVLADLEAEYIALIDEDDCDPFLQNEGHTYDGNIESGLADMECQGMLHEMMNQVSPGGYYFKDNDAVTSGWQQSVIEFDTYGNEVASGDVMADLIQASYGTTISDPLANSYTFILNLPGNIDLFAAAAPSTLSNDQVMQAIADNWRNEWGPVLARFTHPEICHYDQCMIYSRPDAGTVTQTTSSAVYDLHMTSQVKISEQYPGTTDKYLNPQVNSPVTDINPYYTNPFNTSQNYGSVTGNVSDPWPTISVSGGTVADLQDYHLEKYRLIYGLDYSIWEFSFPSATYGTSPSVTVTPGINGSAGNPLLFSSTFTLDAAGDELLWSLYRGAYLQAKTEYYKDSIRLYNAGCPRLGIPDRVVKGAPALPNDQDGVEDQADQILDNLDMTPDNIGTLPSPGEQGDLCYESCENKADLILNNLLSNCTSLFEIYQWLNFQDVSVSPALDVVNALDGYKLEMINYCMADCEPPLAYAIITQSEMDGMENTSHPMHPVYEELVTLQTALDNADFSCPDLTDTEWMETAGDANTTLQMTIQENCDNVSCFETPDIVEQNMAGFINSILGASSPFSVQVNSNSDCTYCGCLPETTTVVTYDGGATFTHIYPSGPCISLSKDCPIEVACSTMYNVTATVNPNGTSTQVGNTTTHLFSKYETDCAENCYIRFYTLIPEEEEIGSPVVFNSPFPASVIASVSGITGVQQTGGATYTGHCGFTLNSPYAMSQYSSFYVPAIIMEDSLGFELNLEGCPAEVVCTPETLYTIDGDYDFNYEQWQEDCIDRLTEAALSNAHQEYNVWVNNQVQELLANYQAACVDPGLESFTMEYLFKEHHYTLYYYDQADNLVQTVPPEGVNPVASSHFPVGTNNHVTWDGTEPAHDMKTIYQYNCLNQPVEQETPDGGLSLFYYDDKGRITHSQNAEQRDKATGTTTITAPYSRTLYDELGRIIQVSERTITFNGTNTTAYYDYPMAEGSPYTAASGSNTELENEVACSCYVDKQITRTYYENGTYITAVDFVSENTRSRVAKTTFQEFDGTAYDAGTHYSYDIHGNVKTMVTEFNHLIHFGNQRYKRTDYKYDLVSGKVNQVHYQPGREDKFIHRYTYDSDNRLTMVETSPDMLFYETDAKYFYYLHGPLARMEVGQRKIQGVDYAYTLHGWLKGVNGQFLDPENELGKDGFIPSSGSNPHEWVARDAYGFVLDYYEGDYLPVGGSQTHYAEFTPNYTGTDIEDALPNNANGLYNGNIARMFTALSSKDINATDPETDPNWRWDIAGTAYQYDQLNRIKKSRVYFSNNGSWSVTESPKYGTDYTYDANGNIMTLKRYGNTSYSSSYLMDDLQYFYTTNTNKLTRVTDAVTGNSGGGTTFFPYDYDNDLKTQGSGNYDYDAIGNLEKDVQNGVLQIKWSVYGKVREVIRDDNYTDLEFVYDASGQRVMKIEKTKDSGGDLKDSKEWKYTVYSRDAQGNIMTIYTVSYNSDNDKMELYQAEVPIYGSSRLGVWNANHLVTTSDCVPVPQYSLTNSSVINTCDPDEGDIPHDPDDAVNMPSGTFTFNNLFNSTFNITDYQIGDKTDLLPQNPNITILTAGSLTLHRRGQVDVIGKKQYEFTDHLGNVLLTTSDVPKGIGGSTADYYQARIKTTTDYYPFGMPMPGRYSEGTEYQTIVDQGEINVALFTFETPVITASASNVNARRPTYDGWYAWGSSYTDGQIRSGSDNWIKVGSDQCTDGMRRVVTGLTASTNYTLTLDVNKGTADSVRVEIFNADASGNPVGTRIAMKGFVTGDAQTMTFTVGAGYTRVYIKITQKNCSTSKYFYVDDIIVTLTASPYTSYLNNNFNTPAMTVTNVTSTKRYFDDWTAWDYSENYDDPQNTGDGQLEVMSGSCNHGMQHYIDVPAGQALTLTFDVDLGTSARMNIWVWDVNGSGALSNARAPGYVTADGSYSFTITAPTQSRILIQFRPNECTGVYNFYMDNVRLYYLGDVFTTVPLNTKSNYRFGYNGKEKTNEVYGEGNLYDYGFRIYDPRTCRFFSEDPLNPQFPWNSPYSYAENSPIFGVDMDGAELMPGGGVLMESNQTWIRLGRIIEIGTNALKVSVTRISVRVARVNTGRFRWNVNETPKQNFVRLTRLGRSSHKEVANSKEWRSSYPNSSKEGAGTSMGRGSSLRPDGFEIDWETLTGKIGELKSLTRSGIRTGFKELDNYIQQAKQLYPEIKNWEAELWLYEGRALGIVHTVTSGQSIDDIAKIYNTTVDNLNNLNTFDGVIKEGQQILIGVYNFDVEKKEETIEMKPDYYYDHQLDICIPTKG